MPIQRVYFLNDVQQIIIPLSILNQQVSSGPGTPATQPASQPTCHLQLPESGLSVPGPLLSRLGGLRCVFSVGNKEYMFSLGSCTPPLVLSGQELRGDPAWLASADVTTRLARLSFFICQARIVMPPCRMAERLPWGQKKKQGPRWLASWRGRRQRTRREAERWEKGPRSELRSLYCCCWKQPSWEVASPRSAEGATNHRQVCQRPGDSGTLLSHVPCPIHPGLVCHPLKSSRPHSPSMPTSSMLAPIHVPVLGPHPLPMQQPHLLLSGLFSAQALLRLLLLVRCRQIPPPGQSPPVDCPALLSSLLPNPEPLSLPNLPELSPHSHLPQGLYTRCCHPLVLLPSPLLMVCYSTFRYLEQP